MPPDDAIPTDVAAPDGGAAVPAGDESTPLPDGVTSPPVPDDAAATRAPGEGARTAAPTGDRAWPTVKRRWSVPWGLLTPVGLFVLVIAVFMPALLAGFANWDDNFLIVQQTAYRGFTRAHVEWMFTTSLAGHYQPLTWLSYALDYRIWELEPLGYHLTNVLLHALTTVAFYFVALRLLAIGFGADACSRRKQLVLAAGFAAAVFGVHPLRAESVAWIAERRDVLSGLPLVLSVACYLRYATARSPRAPHARAGGIGAAWPSGGRWSGGLMYAASVVLCGVSLLAKATAVTLPLVLLVLDAYPLRRVFGARRPGTDAGGAPAPVSTGGSSWRRVMLEKLPFFALSVLGGLRAIRAQVDAGAMHALAEHDALARVAQAVYGLAFYIRKTLVPSGLGPMYELPPRAVLLGPMSWISAVAVAAVAVFAVRRRRRVPALAAALAAYAIMVAPVLGFVQSGRQLVADRYSYVSCLGFAVVAAAGVLTYLSRPAQRADRRRRAVVGLVACVVVAGLSRATLWQTEFWDNPVTLWHRGVQVSPDSAIAHVNYADALATTGHPRAMRLSVKHYRRGLELDPTDDIALAHLARLLAFTGETTAAIGAYRRALVLNPDRRGTPLALARLLVRRHGPQDIRWALLALRDTLERHPDDIDAMLYLAELLATAGDAALRDGGEAVRWATHASEARGGNDPSALRTLATAYAEARRFDDAVETAEKALRLARLAGAPPLAADIDRRITLFRQEKPYHAE